MSHAVLLHTARRRGLVVGRPVASYATFSSSSSSAGPRSVDRNVCSHSTRFVDGRLSIPALLSPARRVGLNGLSYGARPCTLRTVRCFSDTPIDITTALDEQQAAKRVEKRIKEHEKLYEKQQLEAGAEKPAEVTAGVEKDEGETGAGASADTAAEQPTNDATAKEGMDSTASETPPVPRMPAAGALKLNDPTAPSVRKEQESKDLVVRSRTTTGQVLWPATQEDIEILSDSKLLYPAPYEVEGSVIIRLVRLSDPVTSPVSRVVRNRQFGIRGREKWQLLAMGVISCLGIYSLGFWQLKRMEWKKHLIEMRRTRLAMPRVMVNSSPFPWHQKIQDYVYRVVEVRGVFDHTREMHIGPRPGVIEATGETMSGCLVVTPLILEDGSRVLVNRGHVCGDKLDKSLRPELPTYVRVRGVLEEGEVPNLVGQYARLKNRPDRNLFVYLVAEDLAENSGARNHKECQEAVITAFDCLYEDDFQAGFRRDLPFSMRHKEDYLLFWADEHTHFNYAMQWFGMGSLILTMTIYKFIEVSRWKF